MVRTRVTLGLLLSAAVLLLAWLDSQLAGGPVLHILVGITMVAALLEVYALAEARGDEPLKLLPVALVVLFVALDYAARVSGDAALGEPAPRGSAMLLSFYAPMGLAVAAGLVALALLQLVARHPQRWFASAPVTSFGFLYVWFFGAHVLAIRGMGMGYVLALIAVAKFGDAAAYFVGSHWGRHRLAPATSPKKSVEGAVGGLAGGVIAALVAAWLFRLEGGVGFWVVFGLAVGVAAQAGDLVASAIKRSAGAKDSGRLLPTFGGILDIVDSPLLGAPVALWLLAA